MRYIATFKRHPEHTKITPMIPSPTDNNHLSRRQLKYYLNELKSLQNDNVSNEIRYISKLLRLKYSKRTHRILSEKTHDQRIKGNFWQYCKEIFEDEI